MPDLLAACETVEDFAEYDRIEAEIEAHEASYGRWSASSLGEVADLFGAALQTVKQWRTEVPPMPGKDGCYPLKEIIQWRRNKDLQTDLAAAKRQQDFDLGQIQVEFKRLELEREKQQILNRDDVELWAATALIELREGVMQLPELLAAISSQDLKDFVRAEVDRHCRDLLIATQRRLQLAEIGKATE